MHSKNFLALLLILGAICDRATAEDWRQFRGPGSNGVVQNIEIPEVWDASSHVKWKVSVPGAGWSAPIVVGKKVIVTTAISSGQKNKDSEHNWQVTCFDASSGKTLWSKVALKSKPRLETHRDNTYASETPATDGKHIVAYFGMMGVFCYDLDGNEMLTIDDLEKMFIKCGLKFDLNNFK